MLIKQAFLALLLALILGFPVRAQAQTATPLVDTRIECVTRGAQQVCTTTTVERVSSSSAQPTNTPTPSPSPTPTVAPTAKPTALPTLNLTVTPTPLPGTQHPVVDTGLEENVLIGLIALFIFSTFGFVFAKKVQ